MKRILVPTDFSTCANNAVDTAIRFAKRAGSELHFLHFTSIPSDWVSLNVDNNKLYPDVTRMVKQRQDELNLLVRKCEKEGIRASSYIGFNESYQNIIDHIDTYRIDLVIMGSHGAAGFKELFIGSNAQKVVRLSTVPVLVVKENDKDLNPGRMVVVSDFPGALHPEDADPDKNFMKLIDFGSKLKLKIDLLFVNTPGDFVPDRAMLGRMKQYAQMAGSKVENSTIINAYTLEEGISDYIMEHPDALVSMITHGQTGISGLFNKSRVEELVNHSKTSLLSVKMNG